MTSRAEPLICAVCARGAAGYGYLPTGWTKKPPLFVCDDPECLPIARDTFHMKQLDFDRIEEMARREAGRSFGEHCDGLGKTDLATLTAEEFDEAIGEAIKTYRVALKGGLKNEAPF